MQDEAHRRGDAVALESFAARFRRCYECARDPVYGGVCLGLTLSGWCTDGLDKKIGWAQQEALVGLLMVRLHSRDPSLRAWAEVEFGALYEWVYDKFALKKHGYALWMVGSGRNPQFTATGDVWGDDGFKNRKENYHHPRCLMLMEELAGQIVMGK